MNNRIDVTLVLHNLAVLLATLAIPAILGL
jgi:hypothetical protein